jgi:predicted permease
MLKKVTRRLRALFKRSELDRELDEELRFHLEREAEEYVRRGMRPSEARRAALLRFGGLQQIREECREARGVRVFEDLWKDIRYGARTLRRQPGFASVAVLTLALGLGANTAIFSVVNAVVLRPLPYAEPEQLVRLYEKRPKLGRTRNVVSAPDFMDWRAQGRTFDSMAAYNGWSASLTGDGDPRQITGALASADLFRVLRAEPALGRAFSAEEDRPGAPRVVVIADGLWRRRFGADPSAVGKTVTLNGEGYTVVGVMPAGFQFPDAETEVWSPLALDPQDQSSRGSHYLSVVARLKPGVTLSQAQAEMDAIAGRLEQQYQVNTGHGVNVFALHDEVVGGVRRSLFVLLGAVCFVLLIACANVASLLLARGAARQAEIAVRTALGASRWRVVRQLLAESLLLFVCGGGLGLLLAVWGVDLFVALSPAEMPRVHEIRGDAWVFGFAFLVSLVTGLAFGLLPALQASKPDLHGALKEGGRNRAGGRRSRVRALLVVAEVASAMILLVGAGLLLKSFVRLRQVSPGFDTSNLLTMQLSLPQSKYAGDARQADFIRRVVASVGSLPGVRAAGAVASLPLTGNSASRYFEIEGRAPRPAGEGLNANFNLASPDYFRALGVAVVSGRGFDEHDTAGAPEVVVINETMARRFWPDEDPLGKRMRIGNNPWRTVVGVVADVKNEALAADPKPEMFYPLLQEPLPFMTLAVRTDADPKALAQDVARGVREVDADEPVYDVKTMDERLAESVSPQRLTAALVGIFAALAMTLAGVGIYGVISYSVAQQTHEFGIRMALGAQKGDVLKLVLRQGLLLALAGVLLGLAGALALTRVMSSLLYGVTVTDPATFAGVAAVLTAVALAACLLPARRATKVDPMVALRYE